MGSSPSIKELQEKQAAFDVYRKKLETELAAEADKTVAAVGEEVKKYYTENGWKGDAFIAGKSYDFMQAHEWSMANVKTILEGIAKVMLGQQQNPPSGVTITPTEETTAALKGMENLELYLIGKAFQIIAGVIESFGSASELKLKAEGEHKPLGNGFHLFVAVAQNSYRSHDFFNNEAIYEYLYVYQLRFSHGEALKQAEISLTELYENEIAVFKKKIEGVLEQFNKGDLTPKQYRGFRNEYEELISESEVLLKKLGTDGDTIVRV
jgi:hypothetical protein